MSAIVNYLQHLCYLFHFFKPIVLLTPILQQHGAKQNEIRPILVKIFKQERRAITGRTGAMSL